MAAAGLALHARRRPQAGPRSRKAEGGGREILLGDRTLALTLTAAVGALLFFTISVTADPFFVTEVLDAGPTGYGVLMSAWMLGMVAGAVSLARLVPAPRLAVGALAGVAVQGAGMLGAAVGATMALALAGFLVGGVAHGTKNVLLRTLIHERVPEASRGRAFAAYNAARNGAEMAALGAGGVIVGLAGAQVALAVAGAVPLAIGVVTLLVITAPATRRRRIAYA